MHKQRIQIIVAGHICLDIIPGFQHLKGDLYEQLEPGKLIDTGPATVGTGGPVSNTGLALHRLGVATQLMGKVGDDAFGQMVLKIIESYDPQLRESMIVSGDVDTSYSVVLNPPGVDRIFLHHPGANDTFCSEDVPVDQMKEGKIFHFGYPPLMREMYLNGGSSLASLMQRVQDAGFITSLDMALPDPNSEAGQVDWLTILERTLPYVDIFLPSFDEIAIMLNIDNHGPQDISEIGQRLLEMGTGIVVLKLGSQGIYLRTSDNIERLEFMYKLDYDDITLWVQRELISTCMQVDVAGTTGSGDCTIAGFLTALVKGLAPETCVNGAVAVGACNVETMDAVGGIPHWDDVQIRIQQGWQKHKIQWALPDWQHDSEFEIWTKD